MRFRRVGVYAVLRFRTPGLSNAGCRVPRRTRKSAQNHRVSFRSACLFGSEEAWKRLRAFSGPYIVKTDRGRLAGASASRSVTRRTERLPSRLCGACGPDLPSSFNIAGVPQGSLHKYWKAAQSGAEKAVRDLQGQGVTVNFLWKAPLREDDRQEQAKILESVIRQGADGVVLAPFDNTTLVPLVEGAASDGIPFVIIDSALDSPKILSFIATDNLKAGGLAADRMAEVLMGKGKVLLLRYQEGSASTEQREEGFRSRLRRFPEIELIVSDQFAGATRVTAKLTAETLLARHGANLAGVFTPNESSTAGMVMALVGLNLASRIVHIGFDTSDLYLDMLRSQRIQGLVVQDPFRMGELAVKTLVDHLEGKSVPKRIDTGAAMVTSANMDTPEIARLLEHSSATK